MTQHDTEKHPSGGDKVALYGWSHPGNPGRFSMIHKNQIAIPEDSYQRAATGGPADSKVMRIAANFSWVAFQIIAVTERDGVYYAIDGGHRVRAARKRSDIDMLPCMVYDMEGIKEEASAFDATNSNRKPMSAVDRHRAHLIQEDETAIKVERLVGLAGRQVARNSGPGTVSCVNDIKKCIKEDEDSLESVWPVVVEVCEGRPMMQDLVRGLFFLERKASEPPSSSRIRKKIMSIGYDGLVKAAREGAAFFGSRTGPHFGKGMLSAINKGFQKKVEVK